MKAKPPKPPETPRSPRFKAKPPPSRPEKLISAKSRALLKIPPTEEEIFDSLTELSAVDDRTTVIMGAAYLESKLEQVLKAFFRELDPEESRRIFDGASGGILAGMASKIRISYAVKLLHRTPYKALLLINDVRNVFAHSLNAVSFQHRLVEEDCIELAKVSTFLTDDDSLQAEINEPAKDVFVKIVIALYLNLDIMRINLKDGELPP